MSEPFIAEIKMFAGNFAPRGYAFCNGQLLPISQNTALFSLIGTTYGGDGRTTTALPNLQGASPMHWGSGPGLTTRRIGESGGTPAATLTEAQMPSHDHIGDALPAQATAATTSDPEGHVLALTDGSSQRIYRNVGPVVETGVRVGNGQAHENRQPCLGLNFIIALVGLYPSRS